MQYKLCVAINQVAEDDKVSCAFPELRCTVAGSSVVPDVAVFGWERIPREASGRVSNRFTVSPDWAIEILSPDQNQNQVLEKLLHCSENGTELSWLIAPEDESVLIVLPEQRIRLVRGEAVLPVLNGIRLELSPKQLFEWLTL